HVSRHGEIAHPHFAHAVVHVPAEPVKQPLAEGANWRRLALHTAEKQHGMEHDHLQSAVDRIRHAIALVKSGQPRLSHDPAIETRDGIVAGGAAKRLEYHRVSLAAEVWWRGS